MRRKEFMKRILPIIMSMSMIAVDIMPALAANIAAQELQKETVALDGIEEVLLSEKDKKQKTLKELDVPFIYK